jgi:STE24 endopeptidase
MTPRVWAALTFAVLVIALIVVAWVRVPWHAAPAPRADQLSALAGLPPDQVAKGRAFHSALRPATYSSLAISLIIALVLGLTPFGAKLVTWCAKPFGGHWIGQALLGGLVLVFLSSVLTLPLAMWQERILRRYGLSTQTWRSWTVDLLKSYAIGAVLTAIVLLGFYGLTRLAPRSWWAWGAAAAAGFVVLLTFIFPVVIEPVFNKFTPMPDSPLRSDLMAMAARDGVPVKDVLVADASRRTRAVNAYVSGFGATRRIVVYDTLLKEAPEAEVRSVVAHELGHAKDQDVMTGTIIGALGAAAAVIGVYLLGTWTGLLRRAGADSIAEPRALALLLAIGAIAGLIAAPTQNLVSRRIEARADTHALVLTDDPVTFEKMQARLAAVNLSDPDPNQWEFLMFASHPSTVQRMAAARAFARGER